MVREDDRSSEEEAPSKDQPQSSSDDSDLEGEMRSALKQIRKLKKKNPKLMNKLLKKDKDLQPAESENKADESKKEKAKPKKDLMPTGTRLEVKTVYSGPEDDQGRFDWTDKPPKDLGKPAEDEESSEFAFIVRRVKVYNDPRRLMELHSIVVQSPHLRRLLGKALHKYPGVTVSLERLEFEKNFEPLVHRWGTLKEMVAAETDEEAKKHAKMFIDLLETELKETMSTALDFKNNKVMSFELFWTICEPGTIIYSRQNGQEAAFKLESSQYGSMRGARVFWLSCQQLDWDGSKFGTTKINLMIRNFKGTLPIKSLSTHPIHFHPKEDELQKRLRERGALVESLAGSHYKGYTGVGWQHGSCGSKEKYNINGRVMIDTAAWNRFQPNFHVSVKAIGESNGEDDDDADEEDDDDVPYDGKMPDATEIDESCRKPLTDEQRLILAPALRGYALQQKVWVNMFPGCVEEVEFSTKAFNSLVLPSNQKELILGFTQSQQQSDEDKFDDVIKGKGRGMVILLCGAPGVGKTLTAESVAEELHAPLYMMSAAELGLEPRHVETKLQSILQMCQRWKAVLLIDEADIFLEERSLHELERNKLVSVFLRVLEYYGKCSHPDPKDVAIPSA